MKKLASSCVVATLVATASPFSYAQDKNVLEGSYIGLGVGATRAKFKPDDFASSVAGIQESKDESDVGYKALFGIKLDRNWWFEIARTGFGKFSHRYEASPSDVLVQEYKIKGTSLSIMPVLPMGRFALFARLGVFRSDVTSSVGTSTGTVAATVAAAGVAAGDSFAKTKRTTVLGAGAQIDLPGHLGIRVEVEDYGEVGDSDTTGRARARMANLSLLYRF